MADCHPSYLSQVEHGHRPMSRSLAEKVERIYHLRPGTYSCRYRFRGPGRPKAERLSRQALKELGAARQFEARRANTAVYPDDRQVPYHRRSEALGRVENIFWPMGIHLGAQAQREVEALEACWAGRDEWWERINALRFDSWSERRLFVKLALADAEVCRVSPNRLGSGVWVAHSRNGRNLGARALTALVLKHGELSVVIWTQVTLRTAWGFRRPDFLVVVCRRGRKVTVALEVDGGEFHTPDREWLRDQELDMPVLHLPADAVAEATVVDTIFRGLGECLE
jgi:hypothetical protein